MQLQRYEQVIEVQLERPLVVAEINAPARIVGRLRLRPPVAEDFEEVGGNIITAEPVEVARSSGGGGGNPLQALARIADAAAGFERGFGVLRLAEALGIPVPQAPARWARDGAAQARWVARLAGVPLEALRSMPAADCARCFAAVEQLLVAHASASR